MVFLLVIILIILCSLLYIHLREQRKREYSNEDINRIQSLYQFTNIESVQRCPSCDSICSSEKDRCPVCGKNY